MKPDFCGHSIFWQDIGTKCLHPVGVINPTLEMSNKKHQPWDCSRTEGDLHSRSSCVLRKSLAYENATGTRCCLVAYQREKKTHNQPANQQQHMISHVFLPLLPFSFKQVQDSCSWTVATWSRHVFVAGGFKLLYCCHLPRKPVCFLCPEASSPDQRWSHFLLVQCSSANEEDEDIISALKPKQQSTCYRICGKEHSLLRTVY